ncbi:MAG: type IV pilin protein, partial [Cellvibrionales bacterium]|nr:type IV pilin protein [Cellvibrionales bacterium]
MQHPTHQTNLTPLTRETIEAPLTRGVWGVGLEGTESPPNKGTDRSPPDKGGLGGLLRLESLPAQSSPKPPKTQAAFTLIELMIALAILAILTAVAIPAYQGFTTESRRSEGMAALLDTMARQERHYNNNFPPTYTADLTALGYATSPATTEKGHYEITAAACNTDIALCVQLTATPQGNQATDGPLTLN